MILATTISLEIVPFCSDTPLVTLFPLSEGSLEASSLKRLKHLMRFKLDLIEAFKAATLELCLRKEEEVTGGQIWRAGRLRKDGSAGVVEKLTHS